MLTRLNNYSRLYIYIFLLLGLLGNFSCQESALLEDVEIAPDEIIKPVSSTGLKSFDPGEILEQKMQWASYITARVFCQDDEARLEVTRFLEAQSTNAVSIDRLIVSDEHTPRFRTLFLDAANLFVLHNYIYWNGEPTHTQSTPPFSSEENNFRVEDYIDFLTVDNCVELFFPNNLSIDNAGFYYTTAHPMTLAESNNGYEISCEHLGFGAGNWGSRDMIIDKSLVKDWHEVIVVRPYQTEGPPKCLYKEYDDINFTQFLN